MLSYGALTLWKVLKLSRSYLCREEHLKTGFFLSSVQNACSLIHSSPSPPLTIFPELNGISATWSQKSLFPAFNNKSARGHILLCYTQRSPKVQQVSSPALAKRSVESVLGGTKPAQYSGLPML